jgi:hypothetical protein
MKKECNHKTYVLKSHSKMFEGEEFKYKAKTCNDCGAEAWDDKLEKNYSNWLMDLHKNKRHIFQVQYSISKYVQDCISKLLERFPHVEESLLIRALVMVYLNVVENREEILKKVEACIDSDDYKILTKGSKVNKKVQFNPKGFNEILSHSNLFEIKPKSLIEEILKRMIILSIKEDKKMKEFWENEILVGIETILMAA